LKAKNYKVAKQIFATLLKPGFDLTEDQVEKINEKNKVNSDFFENLEIISHSKGSGNNAR